MSTSPIEYELVKERVQLALTRTVTVLGTDDKAALELKAVGDEVTVALLPRNGGKRSPVNLADLVAAVERLKR